jgi:hypothetical protein
MRLFAGLLLAALLLAPQVAAGKVPEPVFAGSGGALFTVGGDLWTEPDAPFNLDHVPFGDMSGGYGVGGGLFFEARFIKYIGLELDLLFEGNRMWYDIELSSGPSTAEFRFNLKYTAIRIPILVKGVFETESMRVSLGLGPEFVFTRGDRFEIEELSDWGADLTALENQYETVSQNDVFLCVAVGFAFKVKMLSIPLNIRYSHNFSQPDGYQDRMGDLMAAERRYTASHSMDLRIQLGLAYDF